MNDAHGKYNLTSIPEVVWEWNLLFFDVEPVDLACKVLKAVNT